MDRRRFLRAAVLGASSIAMGFSVTQSSIAYPSRPGPSPYGPLLDADEHGVELPRGFTSRVVARSAEAVAGTGYTWHGAPDGGACFADRAGWIYVSNAELSDGAGGASAIRFDERGEITDAYEILAGTSRNCAGGGTPWRTWLSCEEVEDGFVFEADPWGARPAVRRDAMGRFTHEAAACDPVRKVVYLTEDEPDGGFYRFIPTAWPNLASGVLQIMTERSGEPIWVDVPDPTPAPNRPTRTQLAATKRFDGGEGACYRNGYCYFTTKGDDRVWAYHAEANTLDVIHDDGSPDGSPLSGVDNITSDVHTGDLYVAEDGDDREICLITPDDVVAPFLRVTGQPASELCGVAFNPAGDRMYFSSQRGPTGHSHGGVTYEISGPFRGTGRSARFPTHR